MIRRRHLRLASRYLSRRFRSLHPFEVQAVLLNACNLRCAYCICPEVKTDVLTTGQWLETIRGLAALGTARIKFQGGEPTMRADFRELCREAKRAGITSAVTTNGLKVFEDPSALDYLDEIIFSLDAVDPEINDALRGESTCKRVLKAVDVALARGVKTYVNMVVTRANLSEMEAMLEFCESKAIGLHIQPAVLDWKFGDSQATNLALSAEELRAMHVKLALWKSQGRGLIFSAWAYRKAADWPDYGLATTPSQGPSACMAGKFYVDIQPNGDVHPCGMHRAEAFRPKNILTDGLAEALLHVRRHDCGDCWSVYLNERKAVFGLKPGALVEMLRRG